MSCTDVALQPGVAQRTGEGRMNNKKLRPNPCVPAGVTVTEHEVLRALHSNGETGGFLM